MLLKLGQALKYTLARCASLGDFDNVEASVLDGSFNSGFIGGGAGNGGYVVFKRYSYAGDAGQNVQRIVNCLYAVLAVHTANENSFDHANQSFRFLMFYIDFTIDVIVQRYTCEVLRSANA